MSKGLKIVLGVLSGFACISFLHLWLNIGFDRLGVFGEDRPEARFKVGFLPVT